MSDNKPPSKKRPMTAEEKRAKDRDDGIDVWDMAIPIAGAALGRRYGAKAGRAAAGLTPTGRRAAAGSEELNKAKRAHYAKREDAYRDYERAQDEWNNMTKAQKDALTDAEYRALRQRAEFHTETIDKAHPGNDPRFRQTYADQQKSMGQQDFGAFTGGAAGLAAGTTVGAVVNKNAKYDPIRGKPRMWDGKKR